MFAKLLVLFILSGSFFLVAAQRSANLINRVIKWVIVGLGTSILLMMAVDILAF